MNIPALILGLLALGLGLYVTIMSQGNPVLGLIIVGGSLLVIRLARRRV